MEELPFTRVRHLILWALPGHLFDLHDLTLLSSISTTVVSKRNGGNEKTNKQGYKYIARIKKQKDLKVYYRRFLVSRTAIVFIGFISYFIILTLQFDILISLPMTYVKHVLKTFLLPEQFWSGLFYIYCLA